MTPCRESRGNATCILELADIQSLFHGVLMQLTATETDGWNTTSGEPIGVESAVGDRQLGRIADLSDGRLGSSNTWVIRWQTTGFVIESSVDAYSFHGPYS